MRYVLTFVSVRSVMKAGHLLKSEGVDVTIIPIPRKISSECGMAIEVQCDDIDKVKQLLVTNNCEATGVYIKEE